VSLLGVFPALLSDAPKLSSGHSCEPKSPPVGAILVVFGGDLCVNIVCEQKMGLNTSLIQVLISNEAEYSCQ